MNKEYLINISFFQLCIDILDHDGATLLQDILGYDSEFECLNAHQALKSYKKDLFSISDYFVMKNGLTSVTNAIIKKLEDNDNVKIKLGTSVTDIGKNHIQIDKKKKYGSTIICCVPYDSIKLLPDVRTTSIFPKPSK